MSVLIVIEVINNKVSKSANAVIAYGKAIAEHEHSTFSILVNGDSAQEALSLIQNYGASKVFQSTEGASAEAISDLIKKHGYTYVLFHQTSTLNDIAAKLSILHNVAYLNNVIEGPSFEKDFMATHLIYSGKAHARTRLVGSLKILGIKNSSLSVSQIDEKTEVELLDSSPAKEKKYIIKKINKNNEGVALSDSEIIVSGGRGLQGPENWGIIDDLAETLGAAKGCSKPVSDMEWRPHHEHIGQTGVKVSPNLYIAVGISGAIQHLAGVANSKSILVINKDSEAPFFKVATYGIIGDAFQVLPKLTAAIRARKNT